MTPAEAIAKLREEREQHPYTAWSMASMVLEAEHARLLREAMESAKRLKEAEATNTRLHAEWNERNAKVEAAAAENTRLGRRVVVLESRLSTLHKLWTDFTSQEMYGEGIRAALEWSDFADWDEAHSAALRALREGEAASDSVAICQPCPPSSLTGAACLLPPGHPPHSPTRFHKYPPREPPCPPGCVEHGEQGS